MLDGNQAPSVSLHDKTHGASCQFHGVAIEQGHGQGANDLTIELERFAFAFQLGQHKAMGLLRDGGDGYAWLAQGGNDLIERDFFASHAASHHANDSMTFGQR